MKTIPVPLAACAKGGRSRSMAKQNAVALAQAAARAAAQERRAALKVRKPFCNAADFLAVVKAGANREIADVCKVSTSTVSKWLGGKKVPLQAPLDAMTEWWRRLAWPSRHLTIQSLALSLEA
ncbi:MAG TPA: hypothetical protein VFC44_13340 [Candidatus Saccharimonadales bacterium]|nr:hypothetical protein [Candidatus Saccharimonadales bacterium]